MNMNEGKGNKPEVFNFLGHDFKMDKIPAGCAIPFSIEVEKVRKMTLIVAEKVAMDTDDIDQIESLTMKYFADSAHLDEAQEIMLQTVKAISVFTEFVTHGQMDEDTILHEADMDEINEFMMKIQEAVNAPLKKHLARLKEEVPET